MNLAQTRRQARLMNVDTLSDAPDRPPTPEEEEEPVACTDGPSAAAQPGAELSALRELEEANFPPREGETQYLLPSTCARCSKAASLQKHSITSSIDHSGLLNSARGAAFTGLQTGACFVPAEGAHCGSRA
jgi:hypothetical protein